MGGKTGRNSAVWMGTGFMLAGLFTICVGTGVVPVDPASVAARRFDASNPPSYAGPENSINYNP